MLTTETLAITYGLSSALVWGAADFSGGLASRQGGILRVVFFSQLIGGLFLALLALIFAEPIPPAAVFAWGATAGIFGTCGLVALYRGLAVGRMGIVAPLSAVVTALVPIIWSTLAEGWPKSTQMTGFAIALMAVWFLSATESAHSIQRSEWLMPVLAGLGFGIFFGCIGHVSRQAVLWPLLAARCASLTLMGTLLVLRGPVALPARSQSLQIALCGICDACGNTFFALAAQMGRLDVAAVLASLYPGSTVLLAWVYLKERLRTVQWGGVCLTLVALVLIAV